MNNENQNIHPKDNLGKILAKYTHEYICLTDLKIKEINALHQHRLKNKSQSKDTLLKFGMREQIIEVQHNLLKNILSDLIDAYYLKRVND